MAAGILTLDKIPEVTEKDFEQVLDAQVELLAAEVRKLPPNMVTLMTVLRREKVSFRERGDYESAALVGKMIALLAGRVKHPSVDANDLGVRSRAFSLVAKERVKHYESENEKMELMTAKEREA